MARRSNWELVAETAIILVSYARERADRSVQLLAKKLGFKNYHLFSAAITGGNEIIIKFDNEGASLDLDIQTMAGMTKKQVREEFETVLSAGAYNDLR